MSSLPVTGNLPRDAHRNAIQGAGSVAWADATGTPITTPVAADTTEIALIAPSKAIRLYVKPLTAAINFLNATGGAYYISLAANQTHSIPCAAGVTRYFGRPSSTAVEFIYELLD